MPAISNELQPETKLSIPVESYLALEKLVQSVRLYILNQAATSELPISHEKISNALHEFINAPPVDGNVPPPKPPIGNASPTQESFTFLERRLHNLRVLIVQLATRKALSNSYVQVKPADINACWKTIFSHPSLLRDALDPCSD